MPSQSGLANGLVEVVVARVVVVGAEVGAAVDVDVPPPIAWDEEVEATCSSEGDEHAVTATSKTSNDLPRITGR